MVNFYKGEDLEDLDQVDKKNLEIASSSYHKGVTK